MPKYKKPSQKQIDQMISACIQCINQGKELVPEKHRATFDNLLSATGMEKFRGDIKKSLDWQIDLANKRGETIPQSILLDSLDLGLIKNKAHLDFVYKTKTLLEVEKNLCYLRHINPSMFSEFYLKIRKKPLNEKIDYLASLSGIDFSKVIDLHFRRSNLKNDLASKNLSPNERKKLRRQFNYVNRKSEQSKNEIKIIIKSRIEADLRRPDYTKRLGNALKDPNLRAREKEIMQDAYQRLKYNQRLKMKRKLKLL